MIIGWYGSRNARTAVSPERGDVGSRTNHRRRLLDRGRGFKSRRKHFFTRPVQRLGGGRGCNEFVPTLEGNGME